MQTPPQSSPPAVWHILTETSVPATELGLALSKLVPVISWIPEMSFTGGLQRWTRTAISKEQLAPRKIYFPLQRGYSRLPRQLGASTFRNVSAMLMAHTADPAQSVLVCTSSFWAKTAVLWPGPVVYYATDLTVAYDGLSSRSVVAADRAMCDIADLVCPNSPRLAAYLQTEADCAGNKVLVLPNATRAANLRNEPFDGRDELPADASGLSRPIAGVIGNMGDNIDWELIRSAMEHAPEYSWLFVGPLPKSMLSRRNLRARAKVLRSPRSMFIGARPYEELVRYARAFDVAVMPYNRIEPTFSGSSTRFYEHLAAGRPMLATRGVEELLCKEPLLTLVDNAEHLAQQLCRLHRHPTDEHQTMLCLASRSETWEARATSMREALLQRLASLNCDE